MDVDVASLVSLSAWAYLVVAGVVALDAVLPVLPSESAVIVAGVLAADGHLHPALVVLAAASGALAGDGLSYTVGRRVNRAGRSVDDLGGRLGDALRWAAGALDERGASVISAARFVPGGRTATTAVAGYVGFPVARFAVAAGVGAVLWSGYAAGIGFLGGAAFEDDPLLAVVVGIAVAVAVTVLVEVVRTLRHRGAGVSPQLTAVPPGAAGPAEECDTFAVGPRRLIDPAGTVPIAPVAPPSGSTAPRRAGLTMPFVPPLTPIRPGRGAPPVPSGGGHAAGPGVPARPSSTAGATPAALRASSSRESRTHPTTVFLSCTRPPATVRGLAAASPSGGEPRPVDPPAERTPTCASTVDRARPCR